MKLYQYWDTGEPPDDVATLVDGFRRMNPELEYEFYDRSAASAFVGRRLGPREQRAFDLCAVPAMQADYFRLCALATTGGLWVDADTEAVQPITGLLDRAPRSLMLEFEGFFGTMLMLFREAGDPFVAAFLELATANIEQRRFTSPLVATGPVLADALRGVLDAEWAAGAMAGADPLVITRRGLMEDIRGRLAVTGELLEAYRDISIVSLVGALKYVRYADPAYKQTETHWPNWRGSIYLEPKPLRNDAQA